MGISQRGTACQYSLIFPGILTKEYSSLLENCSLARKVTCVTGMYSKGTGSPSFSLEIKE